MTEKKIDYSVVLDHSERAKLLEQGYQPDVIDYMARGRYEKLLEDFEYKNAILNRRGTATPYFDFVNAIWEDTDHLMVVTAEEGYQEMDIDELMEYQALRSDVYVVPASFINGYNSTVACKDVYALVIDLDDMDAETLKNVLDNGNVGGMTPAPTYIVNSGSGVHFYYVFRQPVPHYHANRKILKDMYTALCLITKSNIFAKTDWHAITQPFRLPGSRTKLDQMVTGWKYDDKWDVISLAERLNVDYEKLDMGRREILPQREYKEARERYIASLEDGTAPAPKRAKGKRYRWRSSLDGKEGFYEMCLERCYKETRAGSRYRSMCALTVVARKVVTVSKERLEMDLFRLMEHYNTIGRPMKPSEVRKALRMYNDKALQTRSRTLEAWFGWSFHRDAQRRRERLAEKGRVRSKEDVWKIARSTRDVLYPEGAWRNQEGAPTKQEQVQQYREEYPEASVTEVARALGISRTTVYKWWG